MKDQKAYPITLYISILALAFILISGAWSQIYETYTVPALTVLAFLLLFIAWLLGNTRPGFPGRMLGITLFYGLQGSTFRRFEALLVDITDSLSDDALNEFRQAAKEDLGEQYKKEGDEKKRSDIQKAMEALDKVNATEVKRFMQVYGCRRDFTRHVWVVLAEKPIEEYMFASTITSFTLPFGYIRRQAVFGLRHDFGRMKVARETLRVHLFMPLLDVEKVSENKMVPGEFASALAEIGAAIRSALLLRIENRMLRKELKAREKRMRETERQLSRLAKETDIAREAAKSKVLEPPTEDEAKIAKSKPVQSLYYELLFATVAGQIIGAALIPQLVQIDAFMASVLGSIGGAAVFFVFVAER
ncbi:MAG: hypothetical protein QXJ17_04375 [Nitrososphaeria archaeon]